MFRIEYSPQALEDLQHLKEYLTDSWGENVADKPLKKIISDIRTLESYPMSGVDLGKIINISTDYRYLFSERNYIFYRLEFDRVLIIRVISEKQDYIQQLFQTSQKNYEEKKY